MKVLCLSGKKASGKNTASNAIHCAILADILRPDTNTQLVSYAKLNDKGQIVVPADMNGEIKEGILDLSYPPVQAFLNEMGVDRIIKQYSFADPLKQFCINVLGLSWESCYGTNEQKDQPTHLKWEDMPGVVTKSTAKNLRITNSSNADLIKQKCENINCIYHEEGFMSGREVLQWFGSNICRKIYGPCWIKATIKMLQTEQPELAIITDARFINEIEAIQAIGGKVLRLLRNPHGADLHISELELDDYNKFDYVLDNSSMTIEEQTKEITRILTQEFKWLI